MELTSETWTEVRCPACARLGWQGSRLLFRVVGAGQGGTVQVKCHRCKSLIEWPYGVPRLSIKELGERRHK